MTIILENPRRRGSRRRKASSRRRKTTRRRRRVSATRSNPAPRRRRRSRRKVSRRRTHSRRRNPFRIPGLGGGGGIIKAAVGIFVGQYATQVLSHGVQKLGLKMGVNIMGNWPGGIGTAQMVTAVALGWLLKKAGGPFRKYSRDVLVGGLAVGAYNLTFVPAPSQMASKIGLGDYAIGYGADSSDYGVGGTELYGMGDWVTRGQLSY